MKLHRVIGERMIIHQNESRQTRLLPFEFLEWTNKKCKIKKNITVSQRGNLQIGQRKRGRLSVVKWVLWNKGVLIFFFFFFFFLDGVCWSRKKHGHARLVEDRRLWQHYEVDNTHKCWDDTLHYNICSKQRWLYMIVYFIHCIHCTFKIMTQTTFWRRCVQTSTVKSPSGMWHSYTHPHAKIRLKYL